MTLEYETFKAVIDVQKLYHEMLKDLDDVAKQSIKQGDYSQLVKKISDYLQESKSGLVLATNEFRSYSYDPKKNVGERLEHAVEGLSLRKGVSETLNQE